MRSSKASVWMMRRGASPNEACMEAVKRVAASYNGNLKKLREFMALVSRVITTVS